MTRAGPPRWREQATVIDPGRLVTITPAFNGMTGERDIHDELAGLEGRVLAISYDNSGYHLVKFNSGDEEWIHVGRLRAKDPTND
jgi:hypothetical protein